MWCGCMDIYIIVCESLPIYALHDAYYCMGVMRAGVTGVTVEGVRPVHSAGPQSTVEIMAGSGLKYVHATSKGRQVKDSQRIVYYYMK